MLTDIKHYIAWHKFQSRKRKSFVLITRFFVIPFLAFLFHPFPGPGVVAIPRFHLNKKTKTRNGKLCRSRCGTSRVNLVFVVVRTRRERLRKESHRLAIIPQLIGSSRGEKFISNSAKLKIKVRGSQFRSFHNFQRRRARVNCRINYSAIVQLGSNYSIGFFESARRHWLRFRCYF